MQTANSTKSGFASWAGRFSNIGLVGSAIAVLIGFIETVAVQASEPNSDDVVAHDHAADISSGVVASTGEEAARQLSHSGSPYQDVLHQLANFGAAIEGAVHELANGNAALEATAHQPFSGGVAYQDTVNQLSSNGSPFEEAAHYYQLSNSGSTRGDTTSASAHDAALSASLSSIASNGDRGASSASTTSDSFSFYADGPVHLSTDADQGLHSTTDSFTAISDVFAEHSAANAEVTFTSAEPSSFQYSGPSILDTAPGGVSAR